MESKRVNTSIMWAIVSFIAGGVGGGIVGFWMAGRNIGKRYDKTLARERKENDRLSRENRAISKKREAALSLAEEKADAPLASLRDRPSYQNLAHQYGDSSIGTPISPDDDLVPREPFVISEEELVEGFASSDNTNLMYYQEDGVLTDDRDVKDNNPFDTIGSHAMEVLHDTEENLIYVHNDIHDTNYVITVEHNMSYARDIKPNYPHDERGRRHPLEDDDTEEDEE